MFQEQEQKWQGEAGAGFGFKNGHAAFPTQAIEWDGYNYPPAGDCDPPVLGANEGWRPIHVKQSTASVQALLKYYQ